MADHGHELDESERLQSQALDLDKEARKKLKGEGLIDVRRGQGELGLLGDRWGWVLFKKKNLREAEDVPRRRSRTRRAARRD